MEHLQVNLLFNSVLGSASTNDTLDVIELSKDWMHRMKRTHLVCLGLKNNSLDVFNDLKLFTNIDNQDRSINEHIIVLSIFGCHEKLDWLKQNFIIWLRNIDCLSIGGLLNLPLEELLSKPVNVCKQGSKQYEYSSEEETDNAKELLFSFSLLKNQDLVHQRVKVS